MTSCTKPIDPFPVDVCERLIASIEKETLDKNIGAVTDERKKWDFEKSLSDEDKKLDSKAKEELFIKFKIEHANEYTNLSLAKLESTIEEFEKNYETLEICLEKKGETFTNHKTICSNFYYALSKWYQTPGYLSGLSAAMLSGDDRTQWKIQRDGKEVTEKVPDRSNWAFIYLSFEHIIAVDDLKTEVDKFPYPLMRVDSFIPVLETRLKNELKDWCDRKASKKEKEADNKCKSVTSVVVKEKINKEYLKKTNEMLVDFQKALNFEANAWLQHQTAPYIDDVYYRPKEEPDYPDRLLLKKRVSRILRHIQRLTNYWGVRTAGEMRLLLGLPLNDYLTTIRQYEKSPGSFTLDIEGTIKGNPGNLDEVIRQLKMNGVFDLREFFQSL